MPWLFGRRSARAAKSKDARPAASTTPADDPLRRGPSQRGPRRRRDSSRSSASMRDMEKDKGKEKEPCLRRTSTDDLTALPVQRRLQHSPHLRPVTQEPGAIPYNFHSPSHSSLPPAATQRGKLRRPHSLRRDPASESLIRRKSSKRRKEQDHVREEEIRAMTLPMPQKRPAGNSGGMLRRDSKKVKGALNHRFERPTSNVSLPLEDSIHSSMSGNSDRRAFRVSALDMFAPRPTIRCSVAASYVERTSPTAYPDQPDTRREKRPISSRDEKEARRTSRIADLADSLDAGALRDIMERDKRRREKKAKADNDRLRRKLERRAEKQHVVEASGTPATPRKSATGVVGLGIDNQEPTPMEDVRPSTPQTPKRHDISQLPTPIDSPIEEPVVSDARAIRYSRGSVSFPAHSRGPSNVSELPELISEKLAQDTPVQSVELHPVDSATSPASPPRRPSRRRSSDGRRMSVFASLFRRGKRGSVDQGRTTPSEISFSNTSRESMSRQPIPAHLIAPVPPTPPIQIIRPSSVPRRTMSKFREDLPEYPLSPPDSRVQSPEVPTTSAIAARRRSQAPSDLRLQSTGSPGSRSDSPVSPNGPVGNIMSQSLASVDSEASWLSGKPIKRASNRSQMRGSMASSAVQPHQDFNHSYEELGMADDEYFRRMTPHHDDRRDVSATKASTPLLPLDAAAESEEETESIAAQRPSNEEEELVQNVVGRQPTIIHRQPRVKSTEGLLSMFHDDKATPQELASKIDDLEPATPDTPASDSEFTMVQRARSVDFGKRHARHLSAGSAKLLDIQKRSSTSSHGKLLDQE